MTGIATFIEYHNKNAEHSDFSFGVYYFDPPFHGHSDIRLSSSQKATQLIIEYEARTSDLKDLAYLRVDDWEIDVHPLASQFILLRALGYEMNHPEIEEIEKNVIPGIAFRLFENGRDEGIIIS